MKKLSAAIIRAVTAVAVGFFLPDAAQAQPTLVVAQAALLDSPEAATGVGIFRDLPEYTDAQGNTYWAGSFSGTVQFGPFTLTSPGSAGASSDYEMVVAKRNAAGSFDWAISAGGLGGQRCTALAVDATGNVYVAGQFDSPTATIGSTTLTNAAPAGVGGGGKVDLLVAKVSAGGAWQWAARAGSYSPFGADELATAITVDGTGNTYVAGTFDSPVAFFGTIQLPNPDPIRRAAVFLAKLDAAGSWVWARAAGVCCGEALSLASDRFGDVYLESSFGGQAQFGRFSYTTRPFVGRSLAISKIDGQGAWQWLAVVPSCRRNSVQGGGIRAEPPGELYAVGTFNGDTATFGRTLLFNNGPLLPSNQTNVAPYRHTDNAYLARLDAGSGAWRWAVQTQGSGHESLSVPLADGAGKLYTGGYFTDVSGNLNPAPVPGNTFGGTTLYSAGGSDIVVAQLDTAGTWRWARRAGGSGNDGAAPRYFDRQGRVMISGAFSGPTLPLGSLTLLAANGASNSGFRATLGVNGPLAALPGNRAASLSLYPNPARGLVRVAGLPAGQVVRVLDVLGRTVAAGVAPAAGELPLRLPPLPAGMYLVRAGALVSTLYID